MAKTRRKETGYAKRLARRMSGNPGPNQMWVRAVLVAKDGTKYGNPLAAKRITPAELTRIVAEEETGEDAA